jgi:sodium-independent sulfate anion transporter 11
MDHRPTLKAIILDFSSVNNVDITSVQNLIDVRNQLDRYVAPDTVDWHFACINNRWTKRALAAAGFGYYTPEADLDSGLQRWKPIFSVAEIGGSSSAAAAAETRENRRAQRAARATGETVSDDIEERIADTDDNDSLDKQLSNSKAYGPGQQKHLKIAVVQGLNRPLFHIDITAALESAVANVQRKSH